MLICLFEELCYRAIGWGRIFLARERETNGRWVCSHFDTGQKAAFWSCHLCLSVQASFSWPPADWILTHIRRDFLSGAYFYPVPLFFLLCFLRLPPSRGGSVSSSMLSWKVSEMCCVLIFCLNVRSHRSSTNLTVRMLFQRAASKFLLL